MSEEYATLDLGGGNNFFDKTFEESLKDRKIIINDEINADVIEKIVIQIMKYNAEDKGKPVELRKKIFLYLNSVGGSVFDGLAVTDIIKNSKTPIIGVIPGYGYSMGALLFIACHERIMFPTASLLIHDGNTTLSGSNNKVKDLQKFYAKIDDKIKDLVVSNSKISSEEYDDNVDREMYLLADECKEKGLCDKILGIDCDIDYIV